MSVFYKTDKGNGQIRHGDNVEEMKKLPDNSIHSCISDFPYDLSFMGKKWDNTGNFYEWCKERAEGLFRIVKSGGYVCVFGHPKTNHRMKCAFEDVGFNIVEEIDWVYLNGFPKNQDIGKLFDKKAGAEREVVGVDISKYRNADNYKGGKYNTFNQENYDNKCKITKPSTDLAKQWDGFKTSGLKPSHEPITIFQKPLDDTYINNIEKHGCGAMNIDACRVGYSKNDDPRVGKNYSHHAKAGLENGSHKDNSSGEELSLHNPNGRFPPNMMFDEEMAKVLDEQTGMSKSSGGKGDKSKGALGKSVYGEYQNSELASNAGGLGDFGGGSRMFPIFKYCPKPAPKERLLPSGERNPHVTLKPKELIKWLIRLVTPKNGATIDITAGSCTHGVACEELNRDEGYSLKWLNIEWMNTEKEPYCKTGKLRIEDILK